MNDLGIVKGAISDVGSIARKVAWRFMPIIMICYMFAFFDRIIISFAKFQLQSDLQLSDTAYGLGASLFSVGYILFEVPSNFVLYKVGARRWIARIMISWGIATALMALVSTPTQFYVLRFVVGAAEAGFAPGIVYFLMLWIPTRYRGRTTSYMFLASACAGLIGGPVSGLILAYMDGVLGIRGWHWLFISGGIPCIVLGLVIRARLDDRIADAAWLPQPEKDLLSTTLAAEAAQIEGGHSLLDAIRKPAFLMLGLIYFLMQIASYGLNFWTPHLIRAAGTKDPVTIGFMAAIPYICGALTMFAVGRLSDASGARRKYVALCLIAGAAGFFSAGVFAHQPIPLMFALAILGAGIIASIPVFWTLPPSIVTGAGAAGGIALINTLGQLGGLVSPIMIGGISDLSGSTTPALYLIAVVTTGCAALVKLALPNSLR